MYIISNTWSPLPQELAIKKSIVCLKYDKLLCYMVDGMLEFHKPQKWNINHKVDYFYLDTISEIKPAH